MQRNGLRAVARGGLGSGGPEGVDLGGLGPRGRLSREHLLIPQMFFSVLSLAWVMLPPDSDHDNPGPAWSWEEGREQDRGVNRCRERGRKNFPISGPSKHGIMKFSASKLLFPSEGFSSRHPWPDHLTPLSSAVIILPKGRRQVG